MSIFVYVSLYLIGYVLSYYVGRKLFSQLGGYTISDRHYCLFISLFSWVAIVAIILVNTFLNTDNRKAKW